MPSLPILSTKADVLSFESGWGSQKQPSLHLFFARGNSDNGSKPHPNKLIVFLACVALVIVCFSGAFVFLAVRKRMPSAPSKPSRNPRFTAKHFAEKTLGNGSDASGSGMRHKRCADSSEESFTLDEKHSLGVIEEASEGDDVLPIPKPALLKSSPNIQCLPIRADTSTALGCAAISTDTSLLKDIKPLVTMHPDSDMTPHTSTMISAHVSTDPVSESVVAPTKGYFRFIN
ncbi:hypothetical protein FRC07_002849 [Ceratobasidium sp. 392]|nr:hypothetical protein FRC07_002849 [Ceratobasidium sp. 392]